MRCWRNWRRSSGRRRAWSGRCWRARIMWWWMGAGTGLAGAASSGMRGRGIIRAGLWCGEGSGGSSPAILGQARPGRGRQIAELNAELARLGCPG